MTSENNSNRTQIFQCNCCQFSIKNPLCYTVDDSSTGPTLSPPPCSLIYGPRLLNPPNYQTISIRPPSEWKREHRGRSNGGREGEERGSLPLPPWEKGINRVPSFAVAAPSVFCHKLLYLYVGRDLNPVIVMILKLWIIVIPG